MTDTHNTPRTGPASPQRPIMLADLLDDLLWPRLLRVPGLALRPTCLGLGLFTAMIVWLIGSLSSLWSDGLPNLAGALLAGVDGGVRALAAAIGTGDPSVVVAASRATLIDDPAALAREHWLSVLVLLVPMAAVWGVGGCGIARASARDAAMRLSTPWPRALGFALDRWWSLVVALLGPIALIAGIALALALAGGALLSLPVLDLVGAVVYPLMMLAGLVAYAVLIGYLLGSPMLVPAVACEGTDGLDAVQRAFAYVLGRPLRLLVYAAVLLVQGVVVFAVIAVIVGGGRELVEASATALGGERAAAMFAEGPAAGGTAVVARFVIDLVHGLLGLVVIGFGVSYYFAGSTVLYLLMRQLNDGQSCEDLWVPGRVEGTGASVATP